MPISGRTKLIAHLGYPTESFKAPMIYNPYFEKYDIDAVVVPMGCKAEDYAAFLKLVFKLSNTHGALVTMPHKVTTISLLDEVLTTAKVAGACNAIRLARAAPLSATCSTAKVSFAAFCAKVGCWQARVCLWSERRRRLCDCGVAGQSRRGRACTVRCTSCDNERFGGALAHLLSCVED